jgi:hypothetical protein
MSKTHEEHQEDILREIPYFDLFGCSDEQAHRRFLAEWFNETKARLMALASDQKHAARLWDDHASGQSTMYSKLYVFRSLLGAGHLAEWEDLWAVDIKPPKYEDKALHLR